MREQVMHHATAPDEAAAEKAEQNEFAQPP
jgi:hypothetical protein